VKPTTAIAALAFSCLLAACETVEYRIVGTQMIKNDQGHIVGHKDMLRDVRTGEEVEEVTMYVPRLDKSGAIVGYEEPVVRGTVLRGLDGRRIGVRYSDLRSRGSNPGGEGVTVIVSPP
jgi:hypothetical protein